MNGERGWCGHFKVFYIIIREWDIRLIHCNLFTGADLEFLLGYNKKTANLFQIH